MTKYKLVIEIDGDSASDLFAVGPTDLLEFFLPEKLGVNPKDVKSITFKEDLTVDEYGEYLMSERTRSCHTDNYYRDKQSK